MGDFVGGMLKYLRRHPVPRVTVAGGMAKMTKLGQGLLDLHSRRGEVDLRWLSQVALGQGGDAELAAGIAGANTAMEAFGHAEAAGVDLAGGVAAAAWKTAAQALGGGMRLDVVIFDRAGEIAGADRIIDPTGPEPPLIVGVVQRAVPEPARRRARVRPGSARCARSAPRRCRR